MRTRSPLHSIRLVSLYLLIAGLGITLLPATATTIDVYTENAVLEGNWEEVLKLMYRDGQLLDPVRRFLAEQAMLALDHKEAPVFLMTAYEPWFGIPGMAPKYASSLLARHPDNPNAMFIAGAAAATTDDLHQARALFTEALTVSPDQPHVLVSRGIIHFRLGNHNLALADFDHALELRPDYGQAMINRAVLLWNMEEHDLAVNQLKVVQRFEELAPLGYYTLGLLYAAIDRHHDAIAALDSAIELDDDFLKAYYARSLEAVEAGDLKRARDDLKHVAKKKEAATTFSWFGARTILHNFKLIEDLNDVGGKTRDAVLYITFGHYGKAQEILDDEIRRHPRRAVNYHYRCVVRIGLGDFDLARHDIDSAISLNPHRAKSYIARAFLHEINNDIDTAIADLNHALSLNPDMLDAYDSRGWLYHCRGDTAKALADYKKVTFADLKNQLDLLPELRREFTDILETVLTNLMTLGDCSPDTTELIALMKDTIAAHRNQNYYELAELLSAEGLRTFEEFAPRIVNGEIPQKRAFRVVNLNTWEDSPDMRTAPAGDFFQWIMELLFCSPLGPTEIRFERIVEIVCTGDNELMLSMIVSMKERREWHYYMMYETLQKEAGRWKIAYSPLIHSVLASAGPPL